MYTKSIRLPHANHHNSSSYGARILFIFWMIHVTYYYFITLLWSLFNGFVVPTFSYFIFFRNRNTNTKSFWLMACPWWKNDKLFKVSATQNSMWDRIGWMWNEINAIILNSESFIFPVGWYFFSKILSLNTSFHEKNRPWVVILTFLFLFLDIEMLVWLNP